MTKLFSERQGISKPLSLNPEDMPIELRNRLWNLVQKYIDKSRTPPRKDVIEYLWDGFFKKNRNSLEKFNEYVFTNQLEERFYALVWNRVYDFIEFLLLIKTANRDNFITDLNLIFTEEGAPYQTINGFVISLITGEEAQEIEKAIESKYTPVSTHLTKALDFYHKRPLGDPQNSIKESISAVEALARIVLNQPKATLGELADQLNLHPAFKAGIKKFYGWTSDEGGIRHSENGDELKSDIAEARFMLVQCSALVNYIISKTKNK